MNPNEAVQVDPLEPLAIALRHAMGGRPWTSTELRRLFRTDEAVEKAFRESPWHSAQIALHMLRSVIFRDTDASLFCLTEHRRSAGKQPHWIAEARSEQSI